MAIKYGFFNSKDGDRKYTSADIGNYLQGLCSSGVFADDATSLQVIANGGMVVRVQPGRAMLNYKYMHSDEPLDLTLSAGGSQDRIDAIVAYMDLSERACGIIVKQGTQAAVPKAPTMTRNSTRSEYMLASVRVPKLKSQISQVNITDTRGDNSVCGWVTGLIDQVPTGTILLQYQQDSAADFAQMQAYYEQKRMECVEQIDIMQAYLAQQQQEFETWFSTLTEQLNLNGFMQEFTNSITIESSTNTMVVGITDYDPQEDILLVNVGGLIWQRRNYTVSGTGSTATVTLDSNLKAGDVVEFRVIKFRLGTATMYAGTKLLAVDDNGTILTDGSIAVATE